MHLNLSLPMTATTGSPYRNPATGYPFRNTKIRFKHKGADDRFLGLHLAPGSPESSRSPSGGLFVWAATTLRGGAASIRRRPDPEIIELFPGPEFCSQPAWLFPATGPSLGRPGGISVLRKNLRVWAPRVAHFSVSCVLAKLAQFLLKPCLFGSYLARQYRDD